MANKTTNFGLTKPLPEEFYDIGVHNDNMDIIDEKLKKATDAAASAKRTVRLTVGTSDAGWTADQCDYLCDGTADDVEINAAIAALPATGGEIVLLDGSYDIAATIDINKNYVVLRGNGHKTKLYREFDGDRLINISGNYSTVADLSINGMNYSYTNTSNKGIYTNVSNTVIKNCTIEQEAGYGIHIAEGKAKVFGNTVLYCGESGIYIDDDDNVVVGNIVLECEEAGIKVCDSHNVVTGNVARLNTVANLYLYYGTYNMITGNNFAVNDDDSIKPEDAIYLSGSSNTGNIVTNNHVGVGSIYIYGGTDNVVGNPAYTYGTTDLTAGSSALTTGTLHFVYE